MEHMPDLSDEKEKNNDHTAIVEFIACCLPQW